MKPLHMLLAPLVLLGLSCVPSSSSGTDTDCSFMEYYPPHYVAYKADQQPVIDGRLDEPFWEDVAWTRDLIDISGPSFPRPRFVTRGKVRWDNDWLYVGARLEEPQIWATLTKHNSVIFNDNDFEVFVSADGTSHYYKEFEMNAFNTTWSLCLNKPYLNGGYENSTRVFPKTGWDDPRLRSAVHIEGCSINNPSQTCQYWSVEIAFPLSALTYNNTNIQLPPRNGTYYRINFSRVEWHVQVKNDTYVKVPSTPEDNWVLAPTYVIDIHLPEYWAYLQLSTDPVNQTAAVPDPNWGLRYLAMQVYYAQQSYYAENGGFSANIHELAAYNPTRGALDGTCFSKAVIKVLPIKDSSGVLWIANVTSAKGDRVATIRGDRFLLVESAV